MKTIRYHLSALLIFLVWSCAEDDWSQLSTPENEKVTLEETFTVPEVAEDLEEIYAMWRQDAIDMKHIEAIRLKVDELLKLVNQYCLQEVDENQLMKYIYVDRPRQQARKEATGRNYTATTMCSAEYRAELLNHPVNYNLYWDPPYDTRSGDYNYANHYYPGFASYNDKTLTMLNNYSNRFDFLFYNSAPIGRMYFYEKDGSPQDAHDHMLDEIVAYGKSTVGFFIDETIRAISYKSLNTCGSTALDTYSIIQGNRGIVNKIKRQDPLIGMIAEEALSVGQNLSLEGELAFGDFVYKKMQMYMWEYMWNLWNILERVEMDCINLFTYEFYYYSDFPHEILPFQWDCNGRICGCSSGGGSGATGGDNSENKIDPKLAPTVYELYDPSSTLDSKQIMDLEKVMKKIAQDEVYGVLYDELFYSGVKFKFEIDPNIDGNAAFKIGSNAIAFKNGSMITEFNLIEEFIHAIQCHSFYGNVMTNKVKNYEYEVKVFRDILCIIKEDKTIEAYNGCGFLGTPDPDNYKLSGEYSSWVFDIISRREFTEADIIIFNNYCRQFKSYSGETVMSFSPKLLSSYLNF